MALCLEMHRLVGVEHELACSGPRRGRQAFGEDFALGVGVECRMEQLIELRGVDACDPLLAGDQLLARHVDRDLERGLGRALARPGLEDEELPPCTVNSMS